jgi:serine/threonine protein kinase
VQGGHSEPGLWVLRRTGDVRSKYILGEVLGKGQFGVVCIAIDKAKGTRWALKSVSKRRVQVRGTDPVSVWQNQQIVDTLQLVGQVEALHVAAGPHLIQMPP